MGWWVRDVEAVDATHYPLNLYTAPVGEDVAATVKYQPGSFRGAQVVVLAEVLVGVLFGDC